MPIVSSVPPPANKKTAPAAAKTAKTTAARTEALAGLGALAQVPLIATRQYADAGAVGMHWPGVASELAKLAETQEAIGRLIDPLIQIGPYTGLVTAVLPLVLQLGVNHGRVPAGAMGTVPAETLAAQIETTMAQAELEALRAQRDAEQAARAMRDEINAAKQQMNEAMRDVTPFDGFSRAKA